MLPLSYTIHRAQLNYSLPLFLAAIWEDRATFSISLVSRIMIVKMNHVESCFMLVRSGCKYLVSCVDFSKRGILIINVVLLSFSYVFYVGYRG